MQFPNNSQYVQLAHQTVAKVKELVDIKNIKYEDAPLLINSVSSRVAKDWLREKLSIQILLEDDKMTGNRKRT